MLGIHLVMLSGQPGRIVTTEHRINLKRGACPAHRMSYLQGPEMREVTSKPIVEKLRAGIFEMANRKLASTVVFVAKKDGLLRFCVDYRKSNIETVPKTYPCHCWMTA